MGLDLSCELADLCTALGIDKTQVGRIVLEPSRVHILLYKRNEDGRFYFDPETGEPASETLTIEEVVT
jgi:hypothetical protein